MKYNIRAFSMMAVNQTDEILVWFKGPLFYKASNEKIRFVFPWNVSRIKFNGTSAFPVLFWGIRGYARLKFEDVNSDAVKWDSDLEWTNVTKSELESYVEKVVENDLKNNIPIEVNQLQEIQENTNITFSVPEIVDTSKNIIPESILYSEN
jgi:hypothetical protein